MNTLRSIATIMVNIKFLVKIAILFMVEIGLSFGGEIKLTGVSNEYGTDCVGSPFVVAGVLPKELVARQMSSVDELGEIIIQSLSCAEDSIVIGINGMTYKLETQAPSGVYKWTDLKYKGNSSQTLVSLRIMENIASVYDSETECMTEFNKVGISVRHNGKKAVFIGTTAGGCP